jgi:hypothetical protein
MEEVAVKRGEVEVMGAAVGGLQAAARSAAEAAEAKLTQAAAREAEALESKRQAEALAKEHQVRSVRFAHIQKDFSAQMAALRERVAAAEGKVEGAQASAAAVAAAAEATQAEAAETVTSAQVGGRVTVYMGLLMCAHCICVLLMFV